MAKYVPPCKLKPTERKIVLITRLLIKTGIKPIQAYHLAAALILTE